MNPDRQMCRNQGFDKDVCEFDNNEDAANEHTYDNIA